MEKWFKDFQKAHAIKYPWIVKYKIKDGTIHEDQLTGSDAQDIANYVRKINGDKTMIYFIAKLDNNWD